MPNEYLDCLFGLTLNKPSWPSARRQVDWARPRVSTWQENRLTASGPKGRSVFGQQRPESSQGISYATAMAEEQSLPEASLTVRNWPKAVIRQPVVQLWRFAYCAW